MNKIERLKESIELDPRDLDAWINLGDAYYEEGIFSKTIDCYEKALEFDPYSYEDVWNNLGLAYSFLAKYDRAIECYEKALELNPDDAITFYFIYNLLMNKMTLRTT